MYFKVVKTFAKFCSFTINYAFLRNLYASFWLKITPTAGFDDLNFYTVVLVFFGSKMHKNPDEIKHTCFIKINKTLFLTKNRYILNCYS